MPINNPTDSLGIASRDRAERRRWGQFAQHGNIRALDGNAMDPKWDGFLERLHGMKVRQGPSFNETAGSPAVTSLLRAGRKR